MTELSAIHHVAPPCNADIFTLELFIACFRVYVRSVLTHRGVGIEHFVEALKKFSHTEQRYGK